MSGGGGSIGQALGQQGQQGQGAQPVVGYTAATTQAPYQQAPQATPQMSPQVAQQYFAQQRMAQQQQQAPQQQGIQQLLNNMMAKYQQPQMQQAAPQTRQMMPAYGQQAGNPLAYRPDMSRAQAALSNVKPSVFKTDLDAARARIVALEAEQAAAADAQQRSYDSNNYGGG